MDLWHRLATAYAVIVTFVTIKRVASRQLCDLAAGAIGAGHVHSAGPPSVHVRASVLGKCTVLWLCAWRSGVGNGRNDPVAGHVSWAEALATFRTSGIQTMTFPAPATMWTEPNRLNGLRVRSPLGYRMGTELSFTWYNQSAKVHARAEMRPCYRRNG